MNKAYFVDHFGNSELDGYKKSIEDAFDNIRAEEDKGSIVEILSYGYNSYGTLKTIIYSVRPR